MKQILLAGNPNCGKTTLFNALTGQNQKTGNWPGVTVERRQGHVNIGDNTVHIHDLPGVYCLNASMNDGSQDEQIAADAVLSLDYDLIINVIDACHLERHLYLSSQLMELGKPMIFALNMSDLARENGTHINIKRLSSILNAPVVLLEAHKSIGIDTLKQALASPIHPQAPLTLNLPKQKQQALQELQQCLNNHGIEKDKAIYLCRRAAEGDIERLPPACRPHQDEWQDMDMIVADARYQRIHDICQETLHRDKDASETLTAKIDAIVLNRWLGIPVFLLMMYAMFLFAINIGGAFQDFFDISTDAIFVQGIGSLLTHIHAPNWLIAIIANGIGKGINTTLTFIPVIASMFFFLSLLESSGYMARAAFVVDKVMRAMGLPGKSFVPMIVGFGCNVPAIMAARTLDTERDRLMTILMSPFMSCSARLAIYAVFVAAFFPSGGQNVVFSLYLIGILMAILTGMLLRKSHLKGLSSPLILELPAYHRPSFKRLKQDTTLRLRFFVLRAGRLIIPVCVLLGALNAFMIDGSISTGDANSQSLLSVFGQWLSPLFAPMGITQDNWPATVGLLTGMLAKEVVVGTLNSLYAQMGQVTALSLSHFDLLASLKAALWSIPENLSALGEALCNPVLASAADSELSRSAYGVMASRFDGQAGAFAYLLFVLLYIPCVSTMAVIRQEAGKRWMWFSISWSLLLAYACAVIFYQTATITVHPQQSMFWIISMLLAIMAFIIMLWLKGRTQKPRRQDYASSHS